MYRESLEGEIKEESEDFDRPLLFQKPNDHPKNSEIVWVKQAYVYTKSPINTKLLNDWKI